MTSTYNASLQTLQQTSRLDFLFTAGFEMLTRVPTMSRYYMTEFQHCLNEYELTTVKNISRLACTSCGQISIPGLTSQVEIKPRRPNRGKKSHKKVEKKKTTRNQQNVISITCKTCSNTNLYHGSYKKKIPKVTSQDNMIPVIENKNNSSTTASSTTTTTTATTTETTNKKKKNKGKKNNLKALLSKSNSNNNSGGSTGGGGGGLGDFLSSL